MCCFFFFQAEDGIRDLVRSRGLGDVYKRQVLTGEGGTLTRSRIGTWKSVAEMTVEGTIEAAHFSADGHHIICLLYTSDAADERSSVDLGGRRIIKKKKKREHRYRRRIVSNRRIRMISEIRRSTRAV